MISWKVTGVSAHVAWLFQSDPIYPEESDVHIPRDLQGDLSSKCLKINNSMPKAVCSDI